MVATHRSLPRWWTWSVRVGPWGTPGAVVPFSSLPPKWFVTDEVGGISERNVLQIYQHCDWCAGKFWKKKMLLKQTLDPLKNIDPVPCSKKQGKDNNRNVHHPWWTDRRRCEGKLAGHLVAVFCASISMLAVQCSRNTTRSFQFAQGFRWPPIRSLFFHKYDSNRWFLSLATNVDSTIKMVDHS